MCVVALSFLVISGGRAAAHTIDVVELPFEGGTRVLGDGQIFATFPGSETISAGFNFNDGNYIPQVINVNLYEDAAHTIVSDALTITVPFQNPPQITVGLTSDTDGIPLPALTPETIGLTETGLLQTVVTLTNSNGIQTTIRIQSDAPEAVTAAPEPSAWLLLGSGLLGMLALKQPRGAARRSRMVS